jgi:hypothetical protein
MARVPFLRKVYNLVIEAMKSASISSVVLLVHFCFAMRPYIALENKVLSTYLLFDQLCKPCLEYFEHLGYSSLSPSRLLPLRPRVRHDQPSLDIMR